MSVASDVSSEDRARSTSSRRCSGSQQRYGEQHERRGGDQHDHARAGTTYPAPGRRSPGTPSARPLPGEHLGQRAELVGVAGGDAEHLTGRRTLRQHVTHLGGLAGDHLHHAVHRHQPGADDQRVPRRRQPGSRAGSARAAPGRDSPQPKVALGDAVSMILPTTNGPTEPGMNSNIAEHRRDHQRARLLAEQPAEEPARRTRCSAVRRRAQAHLVPRSWAMEEVGNDRREIVHDRPTLRRASDTLHRFSGRTGWASHPAGRGPGRLGSGS